VPRLAPPLDRPLGAPRSGGRGGAEEIKAVFEYTDLLDSAACMGSVVAKTVPILKQPNKNAERPMVNLRADNIRAEMP
jgi:hypothetical protein